MQRQIGHLVIEAKLPQPGQPAASDYLGEGFVIVRDPDTDVVKDALQRIISGVRRGARGGAMNVVMLSPGYPAEMAFFTRALAAVGARVIGVGDQPPHALPSVAREALDHYEHVSLSDEGAVLAALHGLARHARIDQVECLWEPYMILAARIREAFGLPGMTVEQTLPFPRQGADEAGARRRRHPHAVACEYDDRGRRMGGG